MVNSFVDSARLFFPLFPTYLFQQPCVHDEVSSVSLVGLPALQALLYHCQYFQHVAVSACNCYQGRYTFHLQAPADPICGPDPQAVNLFGKFVFLKWLHLTAFMSVSLHIMCLCRERFRKFSVVLEKWHTRIHWQLQETLQLSLHIQHHGQPFSSTLRHIHCLTINSYQVKWFLVCFAVDYRLEILCYTPHFKAPHQSVSQKIPLPADWWLRVGRFSLWSHAHLPKDWPL